MRNQTATTCRNLTTTQSITEINWTPEAAGWTQRSTSINKKSDSQHRRNETLRWTYRPKLPSSSKCKFDCSGYLSCIAFNIFLIKIHSITCHFKNYDRCVCFFRLLSAECVLSYNKSVCWSCAYLFGQFNACRLFVLYNLYFTSKILCRIYYNMILVNDPKACFCALFQGNVVFLSNKFDFLYNSKIMQKLLRFKS